MDIEALVRATPAIYEYPMADRDPLPRWTHGRVTLLGDAAHPMYPVGSNGASQAILDARCLADALAAAEHPREALYAYEKDRLPKTAEVVRLNRGGGPERVIDEVEKINPYLFDNVDDVSQPQEARSDRERLCRQSRFPGGRRQEKSRFLRLAGFLRWHKAVSISPFKTPAPSAMQLGTAASASYGSPIDPNLNLRGANENDFDCSGNDCRDGGPGGRTLAGAVD